MSLFAPHNRRRLEDSEDSHNPTPSPPAVVFDIPYSPYWELNWSQPEYRTSACHVVNSAAATPRRAPRPNTAHGMEGVDGTGDSGWRTCKAWSESLWQ